MALWWGRKNSLKTIILVDIILLETFNQSKLLDLENFLKIIWPNSLIFEVTGPEDEITQKLEISTPLSQEEGEGTWSSPWLALYHEFFVFCGLFLYLCLLKDFDVHCSHTLSFFNLDLLLLFFLFSTWISFYFFPLCPGTLHSPLKYVCTGIYIINLYIWTYKNTYVQISLL